VAGILGITPAETADSRPNTIGLYLDLEGSVDRVQIMPGELFSVHLLITQPTPCDPDADFSWCWGCGLALSANIQVLNWGDQLCGDNAVTPPDFFVCCPGGFPNDETAVRLVTLSALVTDMQPGLIYIRPVHRDGLPINPFFSAWDGITLPLCFNWLHSAAGHFEDPVFFVNGSEPQSPESATWSSLKSLYN
jgi:hypothetical protein